MWAESGGSIHSPGTPLSQHLPMFTHWEAFPTPYFWDFMEASSCRHDWSLAPFSAFLPSQENRGWGWKCQAYNHGLIFPVTFLIQKPTQSLFIRTKYIPITLRMTKISEALCQELESETYTIYSTSFQLLHNVNFVLTSSLCVPLLLSLLPLLSLLEDRK